MPRRSYFSYNFSLLWSLLYYRSLYNCIYTSQNGKRQQQCAYLCFLFICWILLFKQQIVKLKSLAKPLTKLTCTSNHCLIHKLTALYSPAHFSFSTNILYKPASSIPWQSRLASFFHLISNFLISYPLPSKKTSLPGNNFVTLSQAEYCPTLLPDVWGMK